MRVEILTYLKSITGAKQPLEADIFNIAPYIATTFSTSTLAEVKSTLVGMVRDKVITVSGELSSLGATFGGVTRNLGNTVIHAQLTDKGVLELTPTGTVRNTMRSTVLTYMSHSNFAFLNIAPHIASTYPTATARDIKATLDAINSDMVGNIASGEYKTLGASIGGILKSAANTIIHGQITAKGLRELGL